MQIDILTLFPRMFESVLGESMLKRAQAKGTLNVRIQSLRHWTSDRHRTADDKPFGGGSGMVMKIEPVWRALKELKGHRVKKSRIICAASSSFRLSDETEINDFSKLIYFSIAFGISMLHKNQKKKDAFSIKTRKTLFLIRL